MKTEKATKTKKRAMTWEELKRAFTPPPGSKRKVTFIENPHEQFRKHQTYLDKRLAHLQRLFNTPTK